MSLQTRRQFTKLALASLPAAAFFPRSLRGAESSTSKPNSIVAGVQIGLNVPYSFAAPTMSGDEILKKVVQLGLSGIELRAQPVEVFLGAPADLVYGKKGVAKEQTGSGAANLREWRKSAPVDKAKDFREKYESAGVLIEIVKVDGIFEMSDEEIDYAFALVKALGARAMSTEISHAEPDLKRLGGFADKHKMMVGYHGHATTKPEHWEAAFALAEYNGANVDLGHFVAGNNMSPVPFITKYHDRVTHVHVKDRRYNNGPSVPLGEGDTPVAEVLRLIRDNKWPIQGTIEFEYKIPPGSDRMAELARQVKFCRDALA